MKSTQIATLALGLTISAVAQTTSMGSAATPSGRVISVTLPAGALDDQTLVGSLIGTASSQTTLAIGCAGGFDPETCAFGESATITFNPTTLLFTPVYDGYAVTQACSFNSNGGVCTLTAPADESDMTTTGGTPGPTTTTISVPADSLQAVPITITAEASGSNPTTTAGSSGSHSATAGPSGSSSTSRPNDALVLVPSAFGALLMGLAAVLL